MFRIPRSKACFVQRRIWPSLATSTTSQTACPPAVTRNGQKNTTKGSYFYVQNRYSSGTTLNKLFPRNDDFSERHIGPSPREKEAMLDLFGFKVGGLSSEKKICVVLDLEA